MKYQLICQPRIKTNLNDKISYRIRLDLTSTSIKPVKESQGLLLLENYDGLNVKYKRLLDRSEYFVFLHERDL